MGKENFTPDGRHVQLGDTDNCTYPPGFSETDNSSFEPQPFGRVINDQGFVADDGMADDSDVIGY